VEHNRRAICLKRYFLRDHVICSRLNRNKPCEHLPIVRFIARRIVSGCLSTVPIEDLYSAGVLALLDAVQQVRPIQGKYPARC
jgi:hypothetical protein